MNESTLFFIFELIGTVAFAASGVVTALERELDLFGALVLGTAAAVGGGVIRDLILGYLPPAAFRHPVYALVALGTAAVGFAIAYFAGRRTRPHLGVYVQILNLFDSVGLAVFTVAGVRSAAACGFGENAFLSVFVGLLTGVGGGVLRDIMAGQVPSILRKRIYALAAVGGALIYYYLCDFHLCSERIAVLAGAGAVLLIRLLATVFHWNLPRLRGPKEADAAQTASH
ncbi:MAG: TRIC cation channel family protein [Clostridia bacterium]|nr:TRIC cation channel family protein [Clostridia bacterium]